jgi:cysteine desulfuration protein SufE
MERAKNRIESLKKIFDEKGPWEERYKHLIEMGKALPPMDAALQIDDNKIKGCQSQVWLFVQLNPDKSLHFVADSDALIVKGLVALVLAVYQDLPPAEILQTPPQFLKDLGLESHLSPSRANGLQAMVKQIHYYATAYQYLLNK